MALTVHVGDAANAQPQVEQRRGRPLASLDALRRRDLCLIVEPSAQGGFDCTVCGAVQARFHMPVETVLLDNAITQLRAPLMRVVERKDAAGGYPFQDAIELGRASCRDRVCPYVSFSVVAVSLKNRTTQQTSFAVYKQTDTANKTTQ